MNEQWIAGIHAVTSALQSDPTRLGQLCVERGSRNRRVLALEDAARKADVPVRQVERRELERVAGGVRHQGVAASLLQATMPEPRSFADILGTAGADALFLVLDGVTDPHNLGACLRSAAAAGVTAVIVPKDRAAGLTPVVRKVAAGGAEQVPLLEVTNLARALRELKEAGVWLTGLAGEAQQSLFDGDYRGPIALVLGSEGKGMRRLTREQCDYLVRIPMPGNMESLNVSVATGVALFEAVRQRTGS